MNARVRSWAVGELSVGTFVLGKLAKSWVATSKPLRHGSSTLTTRVGLEGAIGDALRASFKPVVDEPLPERLRYMIDKLRTEEQQKKGH